MVFDVYFSFHFFSLLHSTAQHHLFAVSFVWWKWIKIRKKKSTMKYRLRQDSQLLQSRAINWSQDFQTQNLNGSTISISSSTGNINNECTESTSSTETLKWLGSMSDVSVVSQATNTSTLSGK
jgi:hypothetical protein